MERKVVLGLSGGVDSAVAARLLLEGGYSVSAVYLETGGHGEEDARAAAEALGLPFYAVDVGAELEKYVCKPFREDYLAGRTPSPCALCNPTVKFPALLKMADRLGAQWVATGHYARAQKGRLLKGRPANDQSYLLARLTGEQLQRVIFPLGDYDKSSVRAMAEGWNLPVAHKPDSMEICFIPGDDYAAWLAARGPVPPPGEFVDRDGNVLGAHGGIHRYTLGQGSGLGVSGPHKYYVSALLPEENKVVLSDGSDLTRSKVWCDGLNWLDDTPLTAPRRVTVRFRHSRTEAAAVLSPTETGVLVEPEAPARAPTPGQLAVFYDGEAVLGSGWIGKSS